MKGIQDKPEYSRILAMPYRFWKMTFNLRVEILSRLTNPYKNNIPVFLVGRGRSGTTMLLSGLGKSYSSMTLTIEITDQGY